MAWSVQFYLYTEFYLHIYFVYFVHCDLKTKSVMNAILYSIWLHKNVDKNNNLFVDGFMVSLKNICGWFLVFKEWLNQKKVIHIIINVPFLTFWLV